MICRITSSIILSTTNHLAMLYRSSGSRDARLRTIDWNRQENLYHGFARFLQPGMPSTVKSHKPFQYSFFCFSKGKKTNINKSSHSNITFFTAMCTIIFWLVIGAIKLIDLMGMRPRPHAIYSTENQTQFQLGKWINKFNRQWVFNVLTQFSTAISAAF